MTETRQDPHEPVQLSTDDVRELETILRSLVDYLARFSSNPAGESDPPEFPTVGPVEAAASDPSQEETVVAPLPPPQPYASPWEQAAPATAYPVAQPVMPQPVAPAEQPMTGAGDSLGKFEGILFGVDFPPEEAVGGGRSELLRHLMSGDDDAATLVGTLLLFRAASVDRISPLLKEVGEAWYRWRPFSGAEDPMLLALVDWLQRRCEQQGVQHRIELVHPGDRFDSARHHARQRGVEVAEVQGWVVLRDNGRVYTKAGVSLR